MQDDFDMRVKQRRNRFADGEIRLKRTVAGGCPFSDRRNRASRSRLEFRFGLRHVQLPHLLGGCPASLPECPAVPEKCQRTSAGTRSGAWCKVSTTPWDHSPGCYRIEGRQWSREACSIFCDIPLNGSRLSSFTGMRAIERLGHTALEHVGSSDDTSKYHYCQIVLVGGETGARLSMGAGDMFRSEVMVRAGFARRIRAITALAGAQCHRLLGVFLLGPRGCG
jgi:hypothetical protein